jgi:hypothetical protein
MAAAAVLLFTFSMPGLVAKERKPSRLVAGLVSDEAENPIVGAAVVLTDLQTGKKTGSLTSSRRATTKFMPRTRACPPSCAGSAHLTLAIESCLTSGFLHLRKRSKYRASLAFAYPIA